MDVIETIENAFIEALAPAMPAGTIVESTPDDPGAYDSRAAQGCCLVRYFGSTEDDGGATRASSTMRRVTMHLFIGARSFRALGAHTGTYELLRVARETCSGLAVEVPNNERPAVFLPAGDRFFREQNGVWWYVQQFRSTPFRSP